MGKIRTNKYIKRFKMDKWGLLDKEQRKLGEYLKELLLQKYDKVELVQTNLGYQTFKRGIGVHIYSNKYDYKEINLKYPMDATAEDYFETVIYCMENKKWNNEYMASIEERFIIDMLEKYECESIAVFYGELVSRNSDYSIYLDDITSIKFDSTKGILEIEEDGEGTFIVDLNEETIEMVEKINIKDLKEAIDQLNKMLKGKYDGEYRLIGDVIIDINYNFKNTISVCKLNDIVDFSIDLETNTLIINTKDTTFYCGRYGTEC